MSSLMFSTLLQRFRAPAEPTLSMPAAQTHLHADALVSRINAVARKLGLDALEHDTRAEVARSAGDQPTYVLHSTIAERLRHTCTLIADSIR